MWCFLPSTVLDVRQLHVTDMYCCPGTYPAGHVDLGFRTCVHREEGTSPRSDFFKKKHISGKVIWKLEIYTCLDSATPLAWSGYMPVTLKRFLSPAVHQHNNTYTVTPMSYSLQRCRQIAAPGHQLQAPNFMWCDMFWWSNVLKEYSGWGC